MYIKKLRLVNFQKHSEFIAEFTPNVNILWGETDAGKSCIIRAIRWVLFNEPKGDIVRKVDTDKTLVEILLDNGIFVQRIKSDRENAIVIKQGTEEKRYDSIGKVIPTDIINLLGVFPMTVDKEQIILNVAPQISLPFLLDKSATFRMKLFNKLSGNDVLDGVIQSFNKDLLRVNKEGKSKKQDLDLNAEELETTTHKKDLLEKLLKDLSSIFDKNKERHERILVVKKIKSSLRDNVKNVADTVLLLQKISLPNDQILAELKNKVQRFVSIQTIKNRLDEVVLKIPAVSQELAFIEKSIVPDSVIKKLKQRMGLYYKAADIEKKRSSVIGQYRVTEILLKRVQYPSIEGLTSRVNRYDVVNKINLKIGSCKAEQIRQESSLQIVSGELEEEIKKHNEIIKKYDKCPFCKREMTDNVVAQISL